MHPNNSTIKDLHNQNEKVKKENDEILNKHCNRIISLLWNGSTENRLQAAQILQQKLHIDIIEFENMCSFVNHINRNHGEDDKIDNNIDANSLEEQPSNLCECIFDPNSIRKSSRLAAKQQQEVIFFDNEMQTRDRSGESLFLRSSMKCQYKSMDSFTRNDREILSASQSIQMIDNEIVSNVHEGTQQYRIEKKEMDLTAYQLQTRERNRKYRQKKMTEDPEVFRRNKSLSQKRYLARLKEQNPEEFQMRKSYSQKLYMLKKKLSKI